MPSKAINYDNTHLYKIVCKDLDITDMYIGHTTDFASRKSRHKQFLYQEPQRNKIQLLRLQVYTRKRWMGQLGYDFD